jgi:hypothetical protein
MKVGNRDIVGNGTVVTQAGDAVVELTYSNLTYILVFETNTQSADAARIETKLGDRSLEIKLYNFDNSLGVGWFGHVGKIATKKLYLSLIIHALGEGAGITRSIGYTFSTEEA